MMSHNRILVVEDEDNVRDVLAEFLSYRGYLVETAANGLKALPKLGEFAPDLLLTDLQMPGLDGFGLIRRAHEQDPDRAIVVMSALARSELTDAQVNAYTAGYVTKPIDPDELITVIERAIAASAHGQPS